LSRILGVKCTKDTFDWAIVEGASRGSAEVADSGRAKAPDGTRGSQLAWIRKEVHELLKRHSPDEVVLRAVEPGGQGNSLPRAEAEGVVQEAIAAAGASCRRIVAVSLRSAFGAKNGSELDAALQALEVVASIPQTRRDPVTAALVAIPKESHVSKT